MEEGDYAARQMAQGVLDELLQRRKLAQEDKAMAPVREALIKKTREATMAIQEQKDALQLEQKIRKETIKISSQAAGAFLNATGKIELGARTKIATQLQGSSEKFGSAISATNKARRDISRSISPTNSKVSCVWWRGLNEYSGCRKANRTTQGRG